MKSFMYGTIFVLCMATSLHAIQQDDAQLASKNTLSFLQQLWNRICLLCKYPFKRMGASMIEGATETIVQQDNQQEVPGGRPSKTDTALDMAIKRSTATLIQSLKDATDPQSIDAEGAQMIKNILKVSAIGVAELYNPEGEGRKAIENMIRSIRSFLKEHGAIRETLQDARIMLSEELIELIKDFEKMNRQKGVARKAVRSVAENLSQGVDRVGDSVDTSSRKVVRNALIGSVLAISSWFLWKYIDRTIRTPQLVLETSYKNPLERLRDFFQPSARKEMPTMVFSPELEQRLASIAFATKMIRDKIKAGQKNVTFRNLLLWGPPGTGKTMFARLLAQHSGMNYVIMSGASFTQFRKGEGITQMNKLFTWANSCTDGVILFIDEAEAFLGGRTGQDVSKESYQLLTNFLNLSGERSDKMMFVFATNVPESLDPAVRRRIDDAVEMKLPAQKERLEILKLYRDSRIIDSIDSNEELKDSALTYLTDEALDIIAQQTEGLSGGELEAIINALITDASITPEGRLTHDLIDRVVHQACEKQDSFVSGFKHSLVV